MRQIAVSAAQFANSNGTYPPGTAPDAGKKPEDRWSWMVSLEPFLYGMGGPTPVDSAGNSTPSSRGPIPVYRCPADPNQTLPNGDGLTHFIGIAGVGKDAPTLPLGHPRAGVFGYDRRTRPSDIKDGISSTMMIAESSLANGAWVAGGPATDPEASTPHASRTSVPVASSAAHIEEGRTSRWPTAPSGSSGIRSTPKSWKPFRPSPVESRSRGYRHPSEISPESRSLAQVAGGVRTRQGHDADAAIPIHDPADDDRRGGRRSPLGRR